MTNPPEEDTPPVSYDPETKTYTFHKSGYYSFGSEEYHNWLKNNYPIKEKPNDNMET